MKKSPVTIKTKNEPSKKRSKAHAFFGSHPFGNAFFEEFSPWSGGNPAGAKGLRDFRYFKFTDIGRTERDISFIISHNDNSLS